MVGARFITRRWLTGAALAGLLCAPARPAAAEPLSAPEAEVKAAFVFNFGKYVEWPASALAGRSDILICVLGNPTFAEALEDTVGDKTLHERALDVESLDGVETADRCHLLFIDSSWEAQLPELLHALEGRSTLTIGGHEAFAPAGTVISFRMEDAKVRFVVNSQAAERAGLKISSQLLKLAVEVIGTPHDAP